MTGLQRHCAGETRDQPCEDGHGGIEGEARWQLHQQAGELVAQAAACDRNSSSRGSQSSSRRSCVIVLGSLAQKRNAGGTAAAHFSYSARRCGRWKEELISVAAKRVA